MTGTQPPQRGGTSVRRLVLLGASVRSAAESARRGGFHVTGIDQFGDVDTQQACDRFFQLPPRGETLPVGMLPHCRGRELLYVGGLSRPAVTQPLEAVCRLIGPAAETRARLRDVRVLQEISAAAGVRFPETYRCPPVGAKPAGGAEPAGGAKPADGAAVADGVALAEGRWLYKRSASSGGLGVTRWPTCLPVAGGGVLQRWVPGQPHGATFLCRRGRAELLGVCRSLFTRIGNRPFIYAGSLGPLSLAPQAQQSIRRLGQAIVQRVPLEGLLNADLIIGPRGELTLLEINPRWSASSELIERNLGGAPCGPQSLLRIAVTGEPIPEPGSTCYLKRILYAPRRLVIAERDESDRLAANHSLHDIPPAGTVIPAGHPVATLITRLDPGQPFGAADYRRAMRLALKQLAPSEPVEKGV